MTIYTRTGDQGETDLLGGIRVAKDDLVLEVCGTLDELNALIGLARCEPLPNGGDSLLQHIQRRLFDLGGEVMGIPAGAGRAAVGSQDVETIETEIDQRQASLPSLGCFILPTGNRGAATIQLVRTVCRRAERRMVSLRRDRPNAVSAEGIAYLNRLSDLFFVLAREANAGDGIPDAFC